MSKVYTGIQLLEAYKNKEIDKYAKLKDYNKDGDLLDVRSDVISALCYYSAIDLIEHTFVVISEDKINIQEIEGLEQLQCLEIPSTTNSKDSILKKINKALSDDFSKINNIIKNQNKILQCVKQLDREIKEIKEK